MNSNTSATEVTDTSPNSSQETNSASNRVYTQQEFDDAMAKMKAVVTKKALKPFEDLGDLDELRAIKQDLQRRQQEEAVKRGEFEKVLQDLAAKKDAEIQRRDAVIREYKIDTPLVSAAAKLRSVNPEQVKSLLKNSVRLNLEGEVEVVDSAGSVRYNDRGLPLAVDDLVQEFLATNPHFVQAAPATTQGKSSIHAPRAEVDPSKLDMKLAEHRELYRQLQANKKI